MKRSAKLDLLNAILGNGSPFHGSKDSTVEVHGPFSLDDLMSGKVGASPKARADEDDELLEAISGLIKNIVMAHLDDGSDVTDDERKQGTELLTALSGVGSMEELDAIGDTIIELHNRKESKRSIKVHAYYHALADMVLPTAILKFGLDGVKTWVMAHPDHPSNRGPVN